MWNILIVEDDPQDAETLVKGLSKDCLCHIATTADAALEAYKSSVETSQYFDFILLDVQLPKKSGFDVLKSIRQMEEAYISEPAQEVKIIMTTTFKDSLMENYNMGWDEFISKPIDPAILLTRFKDLSTPKK